MQLIHSHQVHGAQSSPAVSALLLQVFAAQLEEWVRIISKPRHASAEPDQNQKTAKFIDFTLSSFGYTVQTQGPHRNLFTLPPAEAREVILVGAHYDSVPGCPGADDNASAVAALLGCAAACSLWRPELPVVFAAFNAEEDGFIGSGDFVANYLPGAPFQVGCAHILEMIGYATSAAGSQRVPSGLPIELRDTGDFLGLLANASTAQAMNLALQLGRTYTPDLPVTALEVVPGAELVFPVLARSDHVPFWHNDIPALMWTDTSEFRNPHYHRSSDTPETLNYPFLREVTQLLIATVLTQARSISVPPSYY